MSQLFENAILDYCHTDVIHHVEFDYTGNRLATASSDKSVIIWNRGSNGKWIKNAVIRCHYGAVWRVKWANPEFGTIICTCSYDGTIAIYEEICHDEYNINIRRRPMTSESCDPFLEWKCHRTIIEDKCNVTDIVFAPKYFGLMIISCNSKGYVRIYEASNIICLDEWTKIREFKVFDGLRCSALAISDNLFFSPLLAVVSDEELPIYMNHKERFRRIVLYQYTDRTKFWYIIDKLYYDKNKPQDCPFNIVKPIYDVAFIPSIGRSYHQLAITVGSEIWIYHLTENFNVKAEKIKSVVYEENTKNNTFEDELFYYNSFRAHVLHTKEGSIVKRISFNMTGTLLTAVCYDQNVFTYQSQYISLDEYNHKENGTIHCQWKCIESKIHT
uniref:WD_REPEATS_REGION domain-containing protein n=1 Tax=Strongyloides papillosus TaxID=174720 RepID=A0A0N5BQY0_STREA